MEACSSHRGDWHRITWFTVAAPFSTPAGPNKLGVWVAPHTIYLLRATALDSASWVVPHEMLHDLLQTGEHPPVFAACGV